MAKSKGAGLLHYVASLGPGERSGLDTLTLLASTRVDSAFLRFRFLSALFENPLGKVEAMKVLNITRPYLDRILEDWKSAGIVEVRDASPEHVLRPKMTVFLVRRPTIEITTLAGGIERIEHLPDLRAVALALLSSGRQAILEAFLNESDILSPSELQDRVHRKDIYRHIGILLRTRLLLKLQTPSDKKNHGKPGVVLKRNYRDIRILLEPFSYSQR